jgi:mono/diheme cytochrome c family protein
MRLERSLAWVIIAGLLAMPGLAAAADAKLDAAAATKGQLTFVRYCVSCHGPSARGDGPLASELRVPVPDLTTLVTRSGGKYPYERVVRIIENGEVVRAHGTPDMPAWGDAFKGTKGTEEATVSAAIRNLNHYLWSVQQPGK